MFKYTKRLIADLRFRWNEFRLQLKEADELDRIEESTEYCHPMAGFAYFTQKKHEREERIRLHKEDLAAIK